MLAKRTFLVLLAVIFAFAVWMVVSPHEVSRIEMNHRRAYERIEELITAEHAYAARYPQAGYACELTTLGTTGLVNAVLASGTQAGYRYELQCTQRSGQRITDYTVTAEPVSPGTTGKYALCADQNGEIWYSENGLGADCLANRKVIRR